VVGGVCGGLAVRLRLRPRGIRVVFALAVLLGGLGPAAYLALWVLVPADDEATSIAVRVVGDRRELQIVLAFSTALLALVLALRALGLPDLSFPAGALLLSAIGGLVVWRGASPAETLRLRDSLNAAPVIGTGSKRGWRLLVARVALGAVLIIFGLAQLSRSANLSGAAQSVLIGGVAFAGGFLVLFAPWWARTLRDLSTERRERVRAQERADMASHVHDSVLQSLALIQKAANDPHEVVRLARLQERELRYWLFNPDTLGRRSEQPETLSGAMAGIEREIEDSYGVSLDLIVVGDCAMDERVQALVAAAREAAVNAAKWSGAPHVAVFAEVEAQAVSIYVRDRGCGFDTTSVPADRQGIARSMVERMGRQGGQVSLASTPGAGTEVELVLPRHRAAL
jgi:signal transduction histidine kinase